MGKELDSSLVVYRKYVNICKNITLWNVRIFFKACAFEFFNLDINVEL